MKRSSWRFAAVGGAVRATQENANENRERWLVLLVCAWGVMLGGIFPVLTFAAYPGVCHYIRYTCMPLTTFCNDLTIKAGAPCGIWAHTGFKVVDSGLIMGTGYSYRETPPLTKYQYCTVTSIYYEGGWSPAARRGLYFHDGIVLPGEQYQPGEPEMDYSRICTPPSNLDFNPDTGKPECNNQVL